MASIQLELNIFNDNAEALKFQLMQQQFDAMHSSNERVRKRLFAKMGEMEKRLDTLAMENNELKTKVNALTGQKTVWIYGEGESLFEAMA